MQKVFVALPSHDGKLHIPTIYSVFDFAREAGSRGIQVDLRSWVGDSMVNSARNVLVAQFMASDCTDLVCVDTDNDWEAGAMLKLLAYPVEMVAAAYRTKTDSIERYPVRWPPTKFHTTHPETGLLEVDAVPFGICRITRSCIEKMTQAYDHLAYSCELCPDLKVWALFDNELTGKDQTDWKERRYWGEDFVFCNRWRAIGGKVWVDPEITTGHTGSKRFEGHLGKALRAQGCEVKTDDMQRLFAGTDYETLFKQAIGEAA